MISITQQKLDDLMAIRDEGQCNMMDFSCVQKRAYDLGLHDFTIWMEKNKQSWGDIVMGDIVIEEE